MKLAVWTCLLVLGSPLLGQSPSSEERPNDAVIEDRTVAAPVESAEGKPDEPGAPVPEPTTLLLVGTGLVGVAWRSRRNRRNRS